MEKESKQTRGFYVEKGSFFSHASVVILAVAVAARLLGTMSLWSNSFLLATQILLPIGCALLFSLFLLLLGRIALWTTILPVLGGAAFFILSASGAGFGLQMIVCIVMSFAATFIYTATLAGMFRTKWLNVIIFVLILVYQIAFHAVPSFGNSVEPISFAAGMVQISSICFVLALLFASLAFRRRKLDVNPVELPKIKDPKVIPPAPVNETESTDAPDHAEVAVESFPEDEGITAEHTQIDDSAESVKTSDASAEPEVVPKAE